ncbi:MAG: hypothetical protein ACRDID_23290 [Ktedonobacterales bacterium]
MANQLRVTLELGHNGKKVVAVAADWPGLERGAKTAEAAIERLQSYRPRYAQVAKLAEMEAEFAATTTVDMVERYPGTGSTDYWGVSFAFSDIDRQVLSRAELERELTLMRACWAYFDAVRGRVSPEMQKGPRGGGRDRDEIAGHVIRAEQDMSAKVGARVPQADLLSGDDLQTYRDAYCDAIRAYHAEGKMARAWPLRYLIRHTAYHTLDHAWEMEDKDLSNEVR